MASSAGRSLAMSFIILPLLACFSEATDFLVGGKNNAWKVPSSSDDSLNKWAEANRFQIGDSLVWKIENEKDSVIQVPKSDYQSCNISRAIESHSGSEVRVKLNRSGAFYFVSGLEENCKQGEKLIVVVLSDGRRRFFGVSPAPAPMEYDGPAVAPTSAASASAVLKGGVLGALLLLAGIWF